eukprot:767948-Hanusia_phi.AAC.3
MRLSCGCVREEEDEEEPRHSSPASEREELTPAAHGDRTIPVRAHEEQHGESPVSAPYLIPGMSASRTCAFPSHGQFDHVPTSG